mgnify:CR=1 FL=1
MDFERLKIAVIGAGNMGSALLHGWIKSKLISPQNISISDVSKEKLENLKAFEPSINTHLSNKDAIKTADVVILAVKPWLMETIAEEIKNEINYKEQILVSIAAGINFEKLLKIFDKKAMLFRVVPNTAAEVSESLCAISSCNADSEQQQLIMKLFNCIGKTFLVPENQLNAFMSLTSCGIAYAFRYIRAAMEGGVEIGISPEICQQAVVQTLKGAVALLEANQTHPEIEIDKVTTPGGITIKGLNEMEANGFSNAVIQGIKASWLKD